ncbi:MAG: aminotransferase class I/II-fold pyridoxal phosphate-dependent enzyme [Cyanobacteria bacterium J06642_3]
MKPKIVAKRLQTLHQTIAPLMHFVNESTWGQREDINQGCDLTFGNPQEMPIAEYVETLQQATTPLDKNWLAYKQNEPEARAVVCKSLSDYLGHQFEPEDIFLTNGAIAGLQVGLKTMIDPGDEVIFITPHWFLYEGMIIDAGAQPVKVSTDLNTFDLDLEAIKQAISPQTRAIIINSPHNPTGKIYRKDTLSALAQTLTTASSNNDRTIYLISDEAYHQVIFDHHQFISPATIYPQTFLVYTYGKVHLTPGQRLGFIALPPQMPDRHELREAINLVQMFAGWSFPNAILQHGIKNLVKLSIDIDQIQAIRDRFLDSLTKIGYQTFKPTGTFYLLVKSPIADDWEFTELLAQHKVYCLPGITFGLPGYFRISLTCNNKMMEKSLPKFALAFQVVKENG